MPDWILKYWVQWLFGIMGAGVISGFAYFKKRMGRQKALEKGVKAILHDRLFQGCHYYTKQGWIGYDDLRNMQYIYEAYHGLDGNGTGTTAFSDINKLPKHKKEGSTE